MLSDPYLQNVLSDEKGKIDKEKLRAFLEDLALFSIFDASGVSRKGMTSNPLVEYSVGMIQEVGKIAEKADYDWDRASALAKGRASRYLNLRVSGLLSFSDRNQKNISAPKPLGSLPTTEFYKFYFKKFFESLDRLVRTDKLSKDWFTNWGRIRPWFVKNFTALTFRYFNGLVAHLAWFEEGVDFDRMSEDEIGKYFKRQYEVKRGYKVNPNAIKLFLLLTKAARSVNFGIQCEEAIIGGENGERIDYNDDFHDYVVALNKILTQARDVNLYIDGNIYFVDKNGKNIGGAVMIKETTADGKHRLILKISKLKPTKELWWKRYAKIVSLDRFDSVKEAIHKGLEEDGYIDAETDVDLLEAIVDKTVSEHLEQHLEFQESEEEVIKHLDWVLKRLELQCLLEYKLLERYKQLIKMAKQLEEKVIICIIFVYEPYMGLLSEVKESDITDKETDVDELFVILPHEPRFTHESAIDEIETAYKSAGGFREERWRIPIEISVGPEETELIDVISYEIRRVPEKPVPKPHDPKTRRLVDQEVDCLLTKLKEIKVEGLSVHVLTPKDFPEIKREGYPNYPDYGAKVPKHTSIRTSFVGAFDRSITEDMERIRSEMGEADIVIGFPFYNEVTLNNITSTTGGKVDAAKLVEDLATQAKSTYPDKRVAIVVIGESKGKGKDYFNELNKQLATRNIGSDLMKLFTFTKDKQFADGQGKK